MAAPPISQVLGCAFGKQATSCWWQSGPAGKSSSESNLHPRLQGPGVVPKFLSLGLRGCRVPPLARVGASVAPSVQLGRDRGPAWGLHSWHPAWGSGFLSMWTQPGALRGELQPMAYLCPTGSGSPGPAQQHLTYF